MPTQIKRKRKPNPDISPRTYYRFLLWFLSQHRGHCTEADLENAVKQYIGPHWKPPDRRMMRVGRIGEQPKWLNSLAWAKVLARKRGELYQCRVGKGKENTVLIAGWLVQLSLAGYRRRPGRSMQKRCDDCGGGSPLSAIYCEHCFKSFPGPTAKVDVALEELLDGATT